MDLLNNIACKVNESLVLEDVLVQVVRLTLEVTQAERCFLLLSEGDELACKAAMDRQGRALTNETISSSTCAKVLETGAPLTVLDTAQHEEFNAQKSVLA